MDSFVDSIADFVRARQLNIAVVGVLTLFFVLYHSWDMLFKRRAEEDCECIPARLSRSRSRSCSKSKSRAEYQDTAKTLDGHHSRRCKKGHRRCPDCGLCFDKF